MEIVHIPKDHTLDKIAYEMKEQKKLRQTLQEDDLQDLLSSVQETS